MYLMSWKFVCDLWFREVFTNNLQGDNEMKWSHKKYNKDCNLLEDQYVTSKPLDI